MINVMELHIILYIIEYLIMKIKMKRDNSFKIFRLNQFDLPTNPKIKVTHKQMNENNDWKIYRPSQRWKKTNSIIWENKNVTRS